MKRKMVSFILCIAMCMALAIPAFAVELSPYGTVHPDGIHAISVRVLSYQRPSGPGVIGYGTVTKLYTKWYASANQQNYIEDADTVVYRCMNG